MSCSTPVIFLIFRRPDLTAQVFEQIRLAQPPKLFVVADGPRNEDEAKLCEQTRQIIETVDWDCEVYKNYSDVNLGGPYCCSQGISWAFEQVEEAIILEDDCLPCQSFFYFCEELLNYYRDDTNVMHISGSNFQFMQKRTEYSYYFSIYALCWGWATWKRSWKQFDLQLKTWPEFRQSNLLVKLFNSDQEIEFWSCIFDRVFNGRSIHWDYAWKYACFYYNGVAITPHINLISNIGFGDNATHTKDSSSPLYNLPTHEIDTILHPSNFDINSLADQFTFQYRLWSNIEDKNKLKSLSSSFILLIKKRISKNFRNKNRSTYIFLKDLLKANFGKLKRLFKRPDFPKSPQEKFLHLGCGSMNHPSFINVDGMAYPHVHYIRSLDNLLIFQEGTFNLVYASHCLEHFSHKEIPRVLEEWKRVLKKGGHLRLSVPDFDLLLKIYHDNYDEVETIIPPLLGGQANHLDFHKVVFTKKYLTSLLLAAGFSKVESWEPQTETLTNFGDWSSRLIIVKGKAYPVSLNLEAIK
jgi:predicted SAM-dependent methyltransferase